MDRFKVIRDEGTKHTLEDCHARHQGIPPSDLTPVAGPAPGLPYVLVITTPLLEGYRLREYNGLVRRAMVRLPTVGQGPAAELERIVGGKVGAEMCGTGRQQAYELCVAYA